MNRIVLIGNGFDLAHGLKTGYDNFINWYWDKCLYNLRTCHYRTLSDGLITFSIKTGQDTWHSLLWQSGYTFNTPKGIDFINAIVADKDNFEVTKSQLIYRVCNSLNEQNWVDIENEYYALLKESVCHSESTKYSPIEINNQLEKLLQLLTQYLGSLPYDEAFPYNSMRTLIYEPIRIDDISIKGLDHFYEHCNNWAKQDRFSWYDQMSRYGIIDGHLFFVQRLMSF